MNDGGNTVREMVLGQSGAAAIVVAALYFIGVLVTVGNWMRTGFSGPMSQRFILEAVMQMCCRQGVPILILLRFGHRIERVPHSFLSPAGAVHLLGGVVVRHGAHQPGHAVPWWPPKDSIRRGDRSQGAR